VDRGASYMDAKFLSHMTVLVKQRPIITLAGDIPKSKGLWGGNGIFYRALAKSGIAHRLGRWDRRFTKFAIINK